MAAAFDHTAKYDQTISGYFASGGADTPDSFPPTIDLSLTQSAVLRYGENSHQQAALYSSVSNGDANLVDAVQLNGKQLSYNKTTFLQ